MLILEFFVIVLLCFANRQKDKEANELRERTGNSFLSSADGCLSGIAWLALLAVGCAILATMAVGR